jgi:hypothetical protein
MGATCPQRGHGADAGTWLLALPLVLLLMRDDKKMRPRPAASSVRGSLRRMRAGLEVLGLVAGSAVAVAIGCGGTSTNTGFGSSSSSSGGSGSSSSSSGGSSSGGSSGSFGSASSGGSGGSSSGGNGCTGQAANFVYVLSAQNDLYSFAPDKKQFTKIGPLQCQTAMQPNSMAVDRDAGAYVNYVQNVGVDTAGAIYKVSTKDASCSGPVMNMPAGWFRVGMGYSSNNAGSTAETLYVAGVGNGVGASTGLGLVDFGKSTIGPIGSFSPPLAGQNAELTGTGDGRLYGFFTTTPVQVAQITKSSGATAAPVPMTGVATPQAWAFSFWGGHFYLYTAQVQGGPGSNVTDYDPASGSVNPSYMTAIGFDVVGAGVSTCAPVTPPQ